MLRTILYLALTIEAICVVNLSGQELSFGELGLQVSSENSDRLYYISFSGFRWLEAYVSCRNLSPSTTTVVHTNSRFAQTTLATINCGGSDTSLTDCRLRRRTGRNYVNITCLADTNRLVGSAGQLADNRVLIKYVFEPDSNLHAWAHLCSSGNAGFDVSAANSYCQNMGYTRARPGRERIVLELGGEDSIETLEEFTCTDGTPFTACTYDRIRDGCQGNNVIAVECENIDTSTVSPTTGSLLSSLTDSSDNTRSSVITSAVLTSSSDSDADINPTTNSQSPSSSDAKSSDIVLRLTTPTTDPTITSITANSSKETIVNINQSMVILGSIIFASIVSIISTSVLVVSICLMKLLKKRKTSKIKHNARPHSGDHIKKNSESIYEVPPIEQHQQQQQQQQLQTNDPQNARPISNVSEGKGYYDRIQGYSAVFAEDIEQSEEGYGAMRECGALSEQTNGHDTNQWRMDSGIEVSPDIHNEYDKLGALNSNPYINLPQDEECIYANINSSMI